MATIQTLRPLTFGMRFATRAGATISNLSNTISTWHDLRTTRRELSKLSDLQLDDIGLTRGDIDQLTR